MMKESEKAEEKYRILAGKTENEVRPAVGNETIGIAEQPFERREETAATAVLPFERTEERKRNIMWKSWDRSVKSRFILL